VGERVVCVYSFALCSAAPTIREIGLLVDLQDLGGLVGLVGARRSCTSRGARAGYPRRADEDERTKSQESRVKCQESSAAGVALGRRRADEESRVKCQVSSAAGVALAAAARPLPLSSLARNNANHSKFAEAAGLKALYRRTLYRARGNKDTARRQVADGARTQVATYTVYTARIALSQLSRIDSGAGAGAQLRHKLLNLKVSARHKLFNLNIQNPSSKLGMGPGTEVLGDGAYGLACQSCKSLWPYATSVGDLQLLVYQALSS
jgi:hypothetical protein